MKRSTGKSGRSPHRCCGTGKGATAFLAEAALLAAVVAGGGRLADARAQECPRPGVPIVYETRRSLDGWLAAAGAAGIVAAVLVEGSSDPLTPAEVARLDRADVNQLDRPATYRYSEDFGNASDALVAAAVAAPVALLAGGAVRSGWRTYTIMYLETMAFAAAIPSIAKGTVERTRPFVYNDETPMDVRTGDDPRGAFFSRHTSLAFASAVFFGATFSNSHPDSPARPLVWTGALAAAAAVGWTRYEAGEHFPTDVLAGAAVGAAAGWIVPRLHENRHGDVVLTPVLRGSRAGLALLWRF